MQIEAVIAYKPFLALAFEACGIVVLNSVISSRSIVISLKSSKMKPILLDLLKPSPKGTLISIMKQARLEKGEFVSALKK